MDRQAEILHFNFALRIPLKLNAIRDFVHYSHGFACQGDLIISSLANACFASLPFVRKCFDERPPAVADRQDTVGCNSV